MTTVEITLTTPVNLRDLGGIPISGGILRSGLAIRSDDLSTVTPETAHDLVSRGLVSVIDLRTNGEVALTGRGPLADHAVAYHHLPLMSDIRAGRTAEKPFPTSRAEFGEMYATMMESAAPQLASALAIIAVAPGATAFHCAAGADRTGVLAAALLLTLGAADDDIVADYRVTGTNMDAIARRLAPVMGVLLARLGFDFDEAAPARDDEPWDVAMRSMLALLRERHGDALAPLRAAGLGDDTVALLRRRALGS
ncbi:tyrosine-protein phosphatase [Rhodococcus zopfii]|uniref:Tyrosine-protein phosphatase n=1 Tax=Rhodococcus zopfii TaxID=43772 RepID=A0ABU3WL12_9NOCA|nr:tyrosine-protein phosphatase [Rhodococcus zopfii]MDV2474651.1 tyrosine-protein phosphatase [Rhodococcus zopfii]